jgi:hypothetical protein
MKQSTERAIEHGIKVFVTLIHTVFGLILFSVGFDALLDGKFILGIIPAVCGLIVTFKFRSVWKSLDMNGLR